MDSLPNVTVQEEAKKIVAYLIISIQQLPASENSTSRPNGLPSGMSPTSTIQRYMLLNMEAQLTFISVTFISSTSGI